MKKILSALVIVAFAVTMSFAATAKKEKKADPAKAECMKQCIETFKQCEKEAKKDKVKKEACKKAKADCEAKC